MSTTVTPHGNPIKPAEVSEDAALVMPGLTQPSTIASIEQTNLRENVQAYVKWLRALRDWKTNAQANRAAGLDLPPLPKKDPISKTVITYADIGGKVVPAKIAEATLEYYAWVETVVE